MIANQDYSTLLRCPDCKFAKWLCIGGKNVALALRIILVLSKISAMVPNGNIPMHSSIDYGYKAGSCCAACGSYEVFCCDGHGGKRQDIYVYQDGGDFYIHVDADCENFLRVWTACFEVGMKGELAEKARGDFIRYCADSGLRPHWV